MSKFLFLFVTIRVSPDMSGRIREYLCILNDFSKKTTAFAGMTGFASDLLDFH